ncbi:hypothetical protein [Kribbella sp. NPDC023855]|uniref:hypothetical protein n=1 Tax=Kribbella sp. NPDC023855 TaxID=3154698 RepID=UPI0033D09F6A
MRLELSRWDESQAVLSSMIVDGGQEQAIGFAVRVARVIHPDRDPGRAARKASAATTHQEPDATARLGKVEIADHEDDRQWVWNNSKR